MNLFDVNILIAAYRPDAGSHEAIKPWFEQLVLSDQPFGMSDLVLSSFVRIVTQRRIFDPPATMAEAMGYANLLRELPNCILLNPGPRHWSIFHRTCEASGVSGRHVSDAYLAAIAIEHGCTWYSLDAGFGRYPDLDWAKPPA